MRTKTVKMNSRIWNLGLRLENAFFHHHYKWYRQIQEHLVLRNTSTYGKSLIFWMPEFIRVGVPSPEQVRASGCPLLEN